MPASTSSPCPRRWRSAAWWAWRPWPAARRCSCPRKAASRRSSTARRRCRWWRAARRPGPTPCAGSPQTHRGGWRCAPRPSATPIAASPAGPTCWPRTCTPSGARRPRRPPTPSSPDSGGPGLLGRQVLILVPHPDDEVVACCAAIGRARAAGARVRALYLTHGCLDAETVWPWERRRHGAIVARRRAEAEAVAALLGVEPAGWSDRAARRLWRELGAAEAQVRAAIAAAPPDQVWVPAFEGGNPDHDGVSAIGRRLADEGLPVLEFAEYNLAGGRPRSHVFPHPTGAETVLELSPPEQAAKRRALGLYASERRNLGYVETRRECL